MSKISFAVIGGSGLDSMPGLQEIEEFFPDTPYGKPSAPIITGSLEGLRVAFLARHGTGHKLSASQVPYRANIYALKELGVERVVSVSACGSLRDDFAPGDIVIPDQIFDFTRHRARTFFEDGIAVHIGVADPFCADLSRHLTEAVKASTGVTHLGGALITIEGPRFSTRGESNIFRAWGMSVINMSTAPEVFLAREAEMCYSVMNHVTDYDVWHITEKPVSVEMITEVLHHNRELVYKTIHHLARTLSEARDCTCSSSLSGAIITRPDLIALEVRQRLKPLTGKYLG
jgi:5'-methylthioadenosine phosphorylase